MIMAEWRTLKFDRVLRWLRSCAVCGSLKPPIDHVCEACEEKLLKLANTGSALLQPDYPFPVYSLFTWNEDTASLLRPFLHGFKRGWALQAAWSWAVRHSSERSAFGRLAQPRFVVPPASIVGQRDHAYALAQAFARQWGSEEPLAFRWLNAPEGRGQKHLSASERAERRFQPLGTCENLQASRSLVFIDDVVTTGSTAMAAYMALGDPESFEVWTLACRPKLAGKSAI